MIKCPICPDNFEENNGCSLEIEDFDGTLKVFNVCQKCAKSLFLIQARKQFAQGKSLIIKDKDGNIESYDGIIDGDDDE